MPNSDKLAHKRHTIPLESFTTHEARLSSLRSKYFQTIRAIIPEVFENLATDIFPIYDDLRRPQHYFAEDLADWQKVQAFSKEHDPKFRPSTKELANALLKWQKKYSLKQEWFLDYSLVTLDLWFVSSGDLNDRTPLADFAAGWGFELPKEFKTFLFSFDINEKKYLYRFNPNLLEEKMQEAFDVQKKNSLRDTLNCLRKQAMSKQPQIYGN